MPETMSRILLAIEAVVICLPLTLLFLFLIVPAQVYFLVLDAELPVSAADAFANLAILATLICAWRLMIGFAFGGVQALRRLPAQWWILPLITAGLGLLVVADILIAQSVEPSAINFFAWGVPFCLPLLHLRLEYQLRAAR